MTVGCEKWSSRPVDCQCRGWARRRLVIDCRTIWPQRAADPRGPGAIPLHKPLLEELQVLAGVAVPS